MNRVLEPVVPDEDNVKEQQAVTRWQVPTIESLCVE